MTWLNREAEFNATEEDRKNYLKWWTAVANHLKDKNYLLSFNLFTEVTMKRCKRKDRCPDSIYAHLSKYNLWTKGVVKEIRDTKGNNAKRILFLSSPNMTADGLKSIDESIYRNDKYMMAEFHFYAAGPSKPKSEKYVIKEKYWNGTGEGEFEPFGFQGRKQVNDAFNGVKEFTKNSGLYTYFAEWQPNDHQKGRLAQWEVLEFAKYFLEQIKKRKIPWSLNVLDRYYDTKCFIRNKKPEKCGWFTTPQMVRLNRAPGKKQKLDVALILKTITDNMN